jgi:hypothetical protein
VTRVILSVMTLIQKLLILVLLALTSCAAFESGGTFNPKLVGAIASITAKAGTDTMLKIVAGDISRLGLRPAELFKLRANQISLSGDSSAFASLDRADITSLFLPPGWNFGIGSDGVQLIANSSSTTAFDDTINTVTRVYLGEYSINAALKVPSGTAPGNYAVQARIDIRGSSPVMLQWVVNVVPK